MFIKAFQEELRANFRSEATAVRGKGEDKSRMLAAKKHRKVRKVRPKLRIDTSHKLCQVAQNVFLSGWAAASDPDTHERYGIRRVVNCTKWELQFFGAANTPDLKVYRVPVEDSAEAAPEIARHFEPAADFIEQGVMR